MLTRLYLSHLYGIRKCNYLTFIRRELCIDHPDTRMMMAGWRYLNLDFSIVNLKECLDNDTLSAHLSLTFKEQSSCPTAAILPFQLREQNRAGTLLCDPLNNLTPDSAFQTYNMICICTLD